MIENFITDHIKTIMKVRDLYSEKIIEISRIINNSLENGGTIFFMGNGGSAADSQHLAAELVGRFKKERKGLKSIALTTDTSVLTAIGNDYGYDRVFERQVEALVRENDVVIGISTSGNSENIIRAINLANEIGAVTIGLLGKDGGKLKAICKENITIPTDDTARVQEAHIMIGHIICALVEGV